MAAADTLHEYCEFYGVEDFDVMQHTIGELERHRSETCYRIDLGDAFLSDGGEGRRRRERGGRRDGAALRWAGETGTREGTVPTGQNRRGQRWRKIRPRRGQRRHELSEARVWQHRS